MGLTAFLVAAARAIETHRDDSLAQDVYANTSCAPPRVRGLAGAHRAGPRRGRQPAVGRFARYFGLRTRALDDFLLRSVRTGPRQVVLLGAGLDTRAFRLDWPSQCAVFEIDRTGVLAFK
ncbi:SAM-dependent methyltransferase, partial [Streptomyces parvulus]|nr:SAM-dependent methyltransferase [Streptomyces parvulus]